MQPRQLCAEQASHEKMLPADDLHAGSVKSRQSRSFIEAGAFASSSTSSSTSSSSSNSKTSRAASSKLQRRASSACTMSSSFLTKTGGPPASSTSTCSTTSSGSSASPSSYKRRPYHRLKESDIDQVCNRNRRALSAEYQLSLLQQELGYSQLPMCSSSQPPNSSSSTTSTAPSSTSSIGSGRGRGPLSQSFISMSSRKRRGNSSFTTSCSTRSSGLSEDDNLSFLEAANESVQLLLNTSQLEGEPAEATIDTQFIGLSIDDDDPETLIEGKPPTSQTETVASDNDEEVAGHAHGVHLMEEEEEADEEEEDLDGESEDNFLDYRIASVTGFTRGRDGVVYYEILVESVPFGPLSAYKVRRRYSEFKALHRKLAKIMAGKCDHSELTELLAMSSWHGNELEQTSSRASSIRSTISNMECSQRLPPLPDHGGLWSFMMANSTTFLRKRAKYFDAMILAAQNHEGVRQSGILTEFLGAPPDCVARDTCGNYVSLSRYAAPKLRLSVEAHERKQVAKNISIKRTGKSPR